MEPTLHFTPAPTIRLVMNEARLESRREDWVETPELETRLETVLDTLDDLHDAVSDGELNALTTMSKADLIGLLRDLIYTAEQTMQEIEDHGAEHHGKPTLKLVRKPS
ncbi:MAG: hypothetical protein U0670_03885 [Anaerolineae bacterium]